MIRKVNILGLVCILTTASLFASFASVGDIDQTRNDYTISDPFRINSNADFALSPKVTGGNGSADNPWIIENYEIDGTGYGNCIYIGNTTDYFVVRDCYLHNASGGGGDYFLDSGLALYNVENGNISFNRLTNNGYGIYLNNSNKNYLFKNDASYNIYNGQGIGLALAYFSNNNSLIENTVNHNGLIGIALGLSSNDNLLSGNNANWNNWYGLYLATYSSYNSVIGNNASSNNGDGIGLWQASSNEIRNNTIISNNITGIRLYINCIGNNLVNNYISSNGAGIYIIDSHSNIIYNNNIIRNGEQAYDDNTNQWDNGYPSGGNYWSDYSGEDIFQGSEQDSKGSDGIGDIPYEGFETDASYSGSKDNYPLMEPFKGTLPMPSSNSTFDMIWIALFMTGAIILAIIVYRKKGKGKVGVD